jgi:hypothetical protein
VDIVPVYKYIGAAGEVLKKKKIEHVTTPKRLRGKGGRNVLIIGSDFATFNFTETSTTTTIVQYYTLDGSPCSP